jgi:hypothetical protein
MAHDAVPRDPRLAAFPRAPVSVREADPRVDERILARRNMSHHDARGLAHLMDDYFALADELEELPQVSDEPPPSRRAA